MRWGHCDTAHCLMMELIYFTHAVAIVLTSEGLERHISKTLAQTLRISYQLHKEIVEFHTGTMATPNVLTRGK